MTNFETTIELIVNDSNFQLDLLERYMKYFVETRYFVRTVKKTKIIREPFQVACKRYLSNNGLMTDLCVGSGDDLCDWETEAIEETKELVQNFNCLSFVYGFVLGLIITDILYELLLGIFL